MAPDQNADPYTTDVHRWWHLSEPSPELRQALDDSQFAPSDRVLDLGCGLGTEVGFLASIGFHAVGIDLSRAALTRALALHAYPRFICASALHLPFADSTFDVLLDRGCFHYVADAERAQYAAEAARVLRRGGRLFLRACLRTAGERNDVDESLLQRTFATWRCLTLERRVIASDAGTMDALIALFERVS